MIKKTFYKTDNLNNIREWNIEVAPGSVPGTYDIIIDAGLQGGQMINTVTTIDKGKGKKTVHEQAVADAQTEINKKVKGGYVDDISKLMAAGNTATIKKPMKGDKYHPTGKNGGLTLDDLNIRGKEVGIQRKLDGWRYRLHVTRTSVTFYTSSGDLTLGFPHIEAEILTSFNKIYDYVNDKYGVTEYYLDGEIYNHKLGFRDSASACASGGKKTSQSELSKEQAELRDKMHFNLFDVCMDAPYTTREKVIKYFYSPNVLEVVTYKIFAEDDEIQKMFELFLLEGYEGLMIRQLDMPYEYKRTKQLTKYKPLVDDEFEVVGFKKSITGNTLGSIECKMADGRTFFATPKDTLGSDKDKQKIWDNQQDYIGKWLTVEMLEYGAPNDEDKKNGFTFGRPRHPRAKSFRKGKSQD